MNLALFEVEGENMKQVSASQYHSKNYPSIYEIIQDFLATQQQQPESICIGVAGAVINNKADIVNLSWEVDGEEIKKITSIQKVALINDLEANAYGLACMKDEDFIAVHEGEKNPGNMAIIAPGTGLGEAGLYWDGKAFHPFATEGGHGDFTPRSEDFELQTYLEKMYGIVSQERVISGPGIYALYQFLRDTKKYEVPSWLAENISEEDPSAAISEAAMQNKAEIAVATLQLFTKYLARECSNLVLKMKSIGGLFLGGGIPPKIAPFIQTKEFMEHYLNCDRQRDLIITVPIKIIKNEKAPMLGAAFYGAHCVV